MEKKYANHTFVFRNLSFDTEEEDLEDKFEEYGELAFCKIVVDPNTERSRGNLIYEVSNQGKIAKRQKVLLNCVFGPSISRVAWWKYYN